MTDKTFDLPIGHPLNQLEERLFGSSHIVHLVLDAADEDDWSLLANLGISCVLPSKLVIIVAPGWVVRDEFETFAVEVIATIPIHETLGDITYVRTRVHWFNKRVTKEMLPSLPSSRPARPFIEAQWDGVQLDRVSLVNFAGLKPHQHMAAAAELSKGIALLFHRDEISTVALEVRKGRGGDRNPKEIQDLWDDSNCERFAALIKILAPKWRWIKSNDYDPKFSASQEWVAAVRERSEFLGLFGEYQRITDDLLLRVTDESLSVTDREPLGLACAHASRELGIKDVYQRHGKDEPSASTLREYYKKGLKLLAKQSG